MKNYLFRIKLYALLTLSLIFVSCASSNMAGSNLNKVFVTNTNRVDLLPTTAITENLEQYQFFEGNFGKDSFNSMLYLQADSTQITVLLLNEFGIEMGSIYYDGMNAILDSSIFPKNLKCEYILLDLQNAYADSLQLKEHYAKYGLEFAENGTERTVSKKGKTIEKITRADNQITITNLLRGYEYKLTSEE
ncbi:MAG: DUF3261 domain-containing protein [Treponema sp.]|nr:DUF3261 domain-containing protein [Candidatus Treponema equifaecale]